VIGHRKVACLAGIVAALLGMTLPAAAQAAAGTVLFALGRVEIERAGESLPAQRGTAVEVGDTVSTGPTGLAQLRLKDGTLLALKSGSRLTVEDFHLPARAEPAAAAPTVRAAGDVAGPGGRSVLRLLRPSAPLRVSTEGRRSLPPELRDVPLGRRRTLAKGSDSRVLGLLAQDPDPTVIRNLLHNPRIREPDVVRLASARPAHVSALREIGSHVRWARRPPVRVALARNPYAPVPLALQMQNGLSLHELREIEHDPTLHLDVRRHAVRRLALRAPRAE